MQTRRPKAEPTRAVQRAGSGFLSLPMASTAMPKAIGTQIVSERTYPWNIVVFVSVLAVQEEGEEGEHREYARDHREGVVVDEAGLRAARHAREPADEPRGAVHHDPVDDGLVAPGPEPGAHAARAAREEPVVEVVEAVLALEDRRQR